MLHHVERAAAGHGPRRRIGKRLQHVPVRRAVADRLECALEFGLRGALVMGFEGSLIFPAFHDDEAVGPARLLQDGELQIRGFAAAQLAIFLDEL